jgi:prevent-host-death family protein
MYISDGLDIMANRTISTVAARQGFSDVLNRAAYGKERVVLSRRGKPVAAVVPIEDISALEALEDARDSALIRKRMKEWEKAGRPGITLEEFAKKHRIRLPARKR